MKHYTIQFKDKTMSNASVMLCAETTDQALIEGAKMLGFDIDPLRQIYSMVLEVIETPNKMNQDQAHRVARHIQSANYGSFASALSCAYLLGDSDNREKLLQAFLGLFERVERDMLAYEAFEGAK